MRHFEDVFANFIDPAVNFYLSARWAKPGLTGEWDTILKIASRANISGVTPFGVTAEHQTKNDFVDVGTLIDGDFILHAEFNPVFPVIAKDLAKPVMACGITEALAGWTNCYFRNYWGIHARRLLHGPYHSATIGEISCGNQVLFF
jgi:hypothetical protein